MVVRGFPLGVMQAVSSGKIVNPYDRDQEQGWDHVDFVIDALLSEGNSGSPVLALSCKTRELELVGAYHAGYKGHGALNVVVGIDQLTDFMRKKRRVPRALAQEGTAGALGVAERTRVREALHAGTLPLFDFGGLFVRAEAGDDALYYHVFSRQFPVDDRRVAVLEDTAKTTGFGDITHLWVQGQTAWREWPLSALGADEHELVARIGESMRLQILHTVDYRRALADPASQEERKRGRELSRLLSRDQPLARDLANNLIDMAERLSSGRDPGAVATTTGAAGAPGTESPPPPSPLPSTGPPR